MFKVSIVILMIFLGILGACSKYQEDLLKVETIDYFNSDEICKSIYPIRDKLYKPQTPWFGLRFYRINGFLLEDYKEEIKRDILGYFKDMAYQANLIFNQVTEIEKNRRYFCNFALTGEKEEGRLSGVRLYKDTVEFISKENTVCVGRMLGAGDFSKISSNEAQRNKEFLDNLDAMLPHHITTKWPQKMNENGSRLFSSPCYNRDGDLVGFTFID